MRKLLAFGNEVGMRQVVPQREPRACWFCFSSWGQRLKPWRLLMGSHCPPKEWYLPTRQHLEHVRRVRRLASDSKTFFERVLGLIRNSASLWPPRLRSLALLYLSLQPFFRAGCETWLVLYGFGSMKKCSSLALGLAAVCNRRLALCCALAQRERFGAKGTLSCWCAGRSLDATMIWVGTLRRSCGSFLAVGRLYRKCDCRRGLL